MISPVSGSDPLYEIELTVASEGFDGKSCWVHARAGAIPPLSRGNEGPNPLLVMTLQKLDLAGSDVFFALNSMRSADLGSKWSPPLEQPSFARSSFVLEETTGLEVAVSDFWPKWHAASGTLLGIGHTVVYEKGAVMKVRPRDTAYAVYDASAARWSPWKVLAMPDDPKFENAGAGSVQRLDLEDGTVLLPITFKVPDAAVSSTTVLRCTFDGSELKYLGHGSELTIPDKRGLGEPSLIRQGGRFYLTMRHDDHGYVSVSDDGQQFSSPEIWRFDDGSDLGNYNTQQHWIAHPEALFLVYTRRAEGNDHVFRHRAPLFIARVDPETLRVVRASEQILVPEHGARLGNFGVTVVSPKETWVTVTEWMQGPGPQAHNPAPLVARGANNRIWVAKLKWNRPNDLP